MPPSAPAPEPATLSTSRWAIAGFAVASAGAMACAVAVARGGPILAARWSILAWLAAWSGAWTVATLCVFRLPVRAALWAVAAVAVVLRLAALSGPPTLSDDLYRYAWDGRVQTAGIDPYRYPPDAPELARLRERWLWPDDAGCARLRRPPGCTRLNRPAARTIYPPLAQGWFTAVYRVFGTGPRHKPWQAAGLAVDLALIGLLPVALRAWNADRRWASLYALSPFPVVEVVNNAHVDGLAAFLVVLALVVAARRRPVWAGALVGAAGLVKLYPVVVLVGLAGQRALRRSALVLAGTGAVAVAVVGYLPHVAAVGASVLGYLPGYLREEHYAGGGRYLLAGMLGLPGDATAALAVAGLGAVAVWVVVRRPSAPLGFAALLAALLLAVTPVQPWYGVTLLAVAAVAGLPVLAVVVAAAYPYFFAVILDADHTVALGRVCYGAALMAVALWAWRSRGPNVQG